MENAIKKAIKNFKSGFSDGRKRNSLGTVQMVEKQKDGLLITWKPNKRGIEFASKLMDMKPRALVKWIETTDPDINYLSADFGFGNSKTVFQVIWFMFGKILSREAFEYQAVDKTSKITIKREFFK